MGESKVESEKNEGSAVLTDQEPQLLDYDKILEHIGGFGRFQLKMFILIWIAGIYCSVAVMSFSFTGAVLEHRCALPECGDNPSRSGLWSGSINSSSYPKSVDSFRCKRYQNLTIVESFCAPDEENLDEVKCHEWVYDNTVITKSIISEFNLVCDDAWIEPVLGSAYMFGMLVGSISFGTLADKIGRLKCAMIVAAVAAVVQCAAAFSVDPIMFFIMRFIAGAVAVGLYQVLNIIGAEFVGNQYRLTCGFILNIFFSLGSCLVGLVAIGVKNWRTLQLIYGAPGFLILTYWWLLPESARWLIAKGRYEEAKKIILKAAKENKKTIPEHLLCITLDTKNSRKSSTASSASHGSSTKVFVEKEGSMIDVMKNATLRKRAFSMFFVWFVVSMSYYGLSMVVTTLSPDYILNYELVMLVEIPSYIAGILLVGTLGRRTMLIIAMLCGGVACIIAGAVPDDITWLASVSSLIGKFFVSAAYAIIYSYTGELFPTAVRSAALGSSSMAARVGSVLAPFIASTSQAGKVIPFTIFGVFALLSGLAIILLPETKGRPLPQTFDDALELEKARLNLSCKKKISV